MKTTRLIYFGALMGAALLVLWAVSPTDALAAGVLLANSPALLLSGDARLVARGFGMDSDGMVVGMPRAHFFDRLSASQDDDSHDARELSDAQLQDEIESHCSLIEAISGNADGDDDKLSQRDKRRLDQARASLEVLFEEEDRRRQQPGRKTAASEDASSPRGDRTHGEHATRAQRNASASRRPSVPAQPRDHRRDGLGGFASSGEYLAAVMAASARGGPTDPRLIANAPTSFGQEAVGTDGGFAVPPDFRATIVSKVMGEDSLLKLSDTWTTESNSITVPVDQTTPWQSSGGIQAYWESEGGQKTQSKPQLGSITVKANKIISLVPLTDELLEDAVSMGNYVNRKAPEKIDFKVTDAIINGTGVGQPLGILASAGLVTIDAESGQAADTVIYANIANAWARMAPRARRNAIWLMNSDAEAQLQFMAFPVASGTSVPVYLPPGGLSGSPYSTLYGRPIIVSEAMPALGNAGDVILADMKQYMSLVKASGLRQDVSIHLFFDYDITAFRFVLRVGGQPWWNAPITRANGPTHGFFVALGARSG